MKLKKALEDHNFPPKAIAVFTDSKIIDLYPPQASAIKKGVLKGASLLMSVPTAAGKTLIAELCMVKQLLENHGRCLYIAPLKALASEKYQDFKQKFASLGIRVGIAIGDSDTPKNKLNEYDVLVATAEKVDSLLRSKARWLIDSLSTVVLDEIHFINDGLRGPTMEILTARIKQLNPNIQFLSLSATVSNADQMAGWLQSELVHSDWRPIPLKEGVYLNERIVFDKHGTRVISEEAHDNLSKLCLDTLRGKGQVLIFVNSRRSAQAVSRQISAAVAKVLTTEERKQLEQIAKKITGSPAVATKICRKLADVVKFGSAFHHAGLKPHQRELIETSFKHNLIKVISCTPTLAAGVNLPARRAIIRDSKRFESGLGQTYIPTSEYKQCAGRAGRPQYDDYGEAVLIAKSSSEMDTLFDKYIHASPEPVLSKLADEAALRMHVLASIAGGYVMDVKGMFEFMSHTFLAYQDKSANLFDLIAEIFEFLHKEKFIEKSGYRFFATSFGQLTSRLYIDPVSSITIRDGLEKIKTGERCPTIGVLHLLSCCPDHPVLNVGKKDMEDLEMFASQFHEEFIVTSDNYDIMEDLYTYLSTIKTTWLLNQWIEEEKEDLICEQFNVGPGDVYRHVEASERLLYAATSIAELIRAKSLTFALENIRNRVRYGIREELLELARLKGVGRVRARALFAHGYHKLNDLQFVRAADLSQIKQIGKKLAQEILDQLLKKSRRKKAAL